MLLKHLLTSPYQAHALSLESPKKAIRLLHAKRLSIEMDCHPFTRSSVSVERGVEIRDQPAGAQTREIGRAVDIPRRRQFAPAPMQFGEPRARRRQYLIAAPRDIAEQSRIPPFESEQHVAAVFRRGEYRIMVRVEHGGGAAQISRRQRGAVRADDNYARGRGKCRRGRVLHARAEVAFALTHRLDAVTTRA